MKNNLIKRRYDTFGMIESFNGKHGSAFAPTTRGGRLFAQNQSIVQQMRDRGAEQLSGTGDYHSGSSAKRFWYGEVKEDLTAIRDTAVAIAEAEDTPDFDDNFRMPRGSGYEVMATAARAFLMDATPQKALFVEFEMPEDFLEDLARDLAEFEKAEDQQGEGRLDQVGGTADLAALAALGMRVRKQLHAIVRNKFKQSPAILAEWETAQHVEAPARTKAATTPPVS